MRRILNKVNVSMFVLNIEKYMISRAIQTTKKVTRKVYER